MAIGFLMAGGMKLFTPHDALAAQMAWVNHFPAIAPKLIGLLEMLGGLGLILPSLLRIKPWLTPLAAMGLCLLMAGAFITHLVLGEYGMSAPSLIMGLLSGFIAWGRSKRLPIVEKKIIV
jgi:putative oxidoreductase